MLAAVARHFAVTVDDLRGKSRNHQIAWARQVAMYLLREETDASLFAIGRQLGGRDHTTIMHGIRMHEERLYEERIRAPKSLYAPMRPLIPVKR